MPGPGQNQPKTRAGLPRDGEKVPYQQMSRRAPRARSPKIQESPAIGTPGPPGVSKPPPRLQTRPATSAEPYKKRKGRGGGGRSTQAEKQHIPREKEGRGDHAAPHQLQRGALGAARPVPLRLHLRVRSVRANRFDRREAAPPRARGGGTLPPGRGRGPRARAAPRRAPGARARRPAPNAARARGNRLSGRQYITTRITQARAAPRASPARRAGSSRCRSRSA